MSHDIESEFRAFIPDDQRIKWSAQPNHKMKFGIKNMVLSFFFIFWTAFSCIWVFLTSKAGGFFFVAGLPFVGIGLFMLFGRGLITRRMKKNTFYALTETSLWVKSGLRTIQVSEFKLKELPHHSISINKNGSGSIYLSEFNIDHKAQLNNQMHLMQPIVSSNILDIENVEEVYITLKRILSKIKKDD